MLNLFIRENHAGIRRNRMPRVTPYIAGLLLGAVIILFPRSASAEIFTEGAPCEDAQLVTVEIFHQSGLPHNATENVPGSREITSIAETCECNCPGPINAPALTRGSSVTWGKEGAWTIGVNLWDVVTIERANAVSRENEENRSITIDPNGMVVPCGKKHYQVFYKKKRVESQSVFTVPGRCVDGEETKDAPIPPQTTWTEHKRVLTRTYWYGISRGPIPCADPGEE